MGTAKKYSPAVRERAVRLVFDHEHEHDSGIDIGSASHWVAVPDVDDQPVRELRRSAAQRRRCATGFGERSGMPGAVAGADD